VKQPRVAVVIPCHRVRERVVSVIERIPASCGRIVVVDDACPERSGEHVAAQVKDERVQVLFNDENLGVGGATLRGFAHAAEDGADILVKMDGDGQMDPRLLPLFTAPLAEGRADYAKGNRFHDLEGLKDMPWPRLLGNAVFSFFAKLSTGYWNIFDPNNGYLALNAAVFRALPGGKIDRGYFFESDLLFRLGLLRAVVCDVPMRSRYAGEVSGIRAVREAPLFLFKHIRNLFKRIAYNYFLRDFNLASIELVLGGALLIFGLSFGAVKWMESAEAMMTTPVGTIMLSALSIILGSQFLLAFINYDVQMVPRTPVAGLLRGLSRNDDGGEIDDGEIK